MYRLVISGISFTIWMLIFAVQTSLSFASGSHLDEELLRAVYAQDIVLMEKILKRGANVNATDKGGLITPLGIAASEGNIKVVDFLLAKGAAPQGAKASPNLPIYFAITGNRIDVVKRLLDRGISPNYAWPQKDGGTLLIAAVQSGQMEIVKMLVSRRADVNFCGNGEYSPLYRSIISDRYDIFRFLLDRGAHLNTNDKEALSQLKGKTFKSTKKYLNYLKTRKNKK